MQSTSPQHRIVETGPLVLFDGVCNMCSALVGFLAPRDRTGQLHYAPVQSVAGQTVLARNGLPPDYLDSFVFLDNGTAYLKSQAFFRIMRYMTAPWPMLTIFRFFPQPLSDWIYDRVARNRYRMFGKRDTCMVPDKDIAARFLG